jgi:hypothetical protein
VNRHTDANTLLEWLAGCLVMHHRFLRLGAFSQNLPNDCQKLGASHRILETGLGPSLKRALLICVTVTPGENDNRDQSKTVICPKSLHDSDAVTGGQANIQDNEIRGLWPRLYSSIHPVLKTRRSFLP